MATYIGIITTNSARGTHPIKIGYAPTSLFNEPGGFTKDEAETTRIANLVPMFTSESVPLHKYKATGTVTQNAIPVERTLRLYRNSTGELMSETTSSAEGTYTLTTPYNEDHYVVCLDATGGEDFNHLIRKNVDIVSL